ISREEVGGLLVKYKRGLIRRVYGLELKKRNDKKIRLLDGKNQTALLSIRGELMKAMGIEQENSQSSAATELALRR
ncbi:MAG TPA: hypothetical protein VGF52_03530, partial [Tepidisphaeraceae bacterium]